MLEVRALFSLRSLTALFWRDAAAKVSDNINVGSLSSVDSSPARGILVRESRHWCNAVERSSREPGSLALKRILPDVLGTSGPATRSSPPHRTFRRYTAGLLRTYIASRPHTDVERTRPKCGSRPRLSVSYGKYSISTVTKIYTHIFIRSMYREREIK